MKHPRVIVFTSPSGAGKTTIVRHLLSKYENLAFSISATTRKQRNGEINGIHYYFYNEVEFLHLVKEQAFLEWEEVYPGLYYGTLVSEIDRMHKLGKIVVLDIDVKGAASIKKRYGNHALSVFVRPPSIEILVERLKNRNTENPEELQKRIDRMQFEINHEGDFDVVITNDILEVALKEADHIVEDFFERTL